MFKKGDKIRLRTNPGIIKAVLNTMDDMVLFGPGGGWTPNEMWELEPEVQEYSNLKEFQALLEKWGV